MGLVGNLLKGSVIGIGSVAVADSLNRSVFKNSVRGKRTEEFIGNTFRYSLGKINYIKIGKGSPLLLIHELSPFSSIYEWSRVMNRLVQNHTVYAIDLLGCGHSEKPAITYTSFLFTQIIYQFINHVIKEPTDVIASGLSCAFALLAAQGFTENIGNLTLINPPSVRDLYQDPDKKEQSLPDKLLKYPIAGTFIYNLSTGRMATRQRLNHGLIRPISSVSRETFKSFHESAHIGGPNNRFLLNSINQGYLWVDLSKSIKKTDNMNIIISRGEKRKKEIRLDYVGLNKNSNMFYVNNSMHYPQLENPEEFVKIIDESILNKH